MDRSQSALCIQYLSLKPPVHHSHSFKLETPPSLGSSKLHLEKMPCIRRDKADWVPTRLRRSCRLMVIQSPSLVLDATAAVDFFSQEDLVSHMLTFLPLSSIIAVGHASKYYQNVVMGVFRRRIQFILSLFFNGDTNGLDRVFRLMRSSNSAIAGSSVLSLLDFPWNGCAPWDVNILIPLGYANDWDRLMRSIGLVHIGGPIDDIHSEHYGSHMEYHSRAVCLVSLSTTMTDAF